MTALSNSHWWESVYLAIYSLLYTKKQKEGEQIGKLSSEENKQRGELRRAREQYLLLTNWPTLKAEEEEDEEEEEEAWRTGLWDIDAWLWAKCRRLDCEAACPTCVWEGWWSYMLKCKNRYLESEAVIEILQCTVSPIYFWGTNHIGALNTMGFVQVTVLQHKKSELF